MRRLPGVLRAALGVTALCFSSDLRPVGCSAGGGEGSLPGAVEGVSPPTSPVARGWRKAAATNCLLSALTVKTYGPFDAILTLSHGDTVVAFEPAAPVALCAIPPETEDAALFHVVCSNESVPAEGSNSASARPSFYRFAPDLSYRLSMLPSSFPGTVSSIVASSLKRLAIRKEFRKSNAIAELYSWLEGRKEKRETYVLKCDAGLKAFNPHFSFTSFWGELLQAAYEPRNFKDITLPAFPPEG